MAKKKGTRYEARAAYKYEQLEDHLQQIVIEAIIRDKTVSIEWAEEYGARTHTTLTQTNGPIYTGESVWALGTRKELHGMVEASLYSNEIGYILVGEETWPNEKDWFVVQLFNGTGIE